MIQSTENWPELGDGIESLRQEIAVLRESLDEFGLDSTNDLQDLANQFGILNKVSCSPRTAKSDQ